MSDKKNYCLSLDENCPMIKDENGNLQYRKNLKSCESCIYFVRGITTNKENNMIPIFLTEQAYDLIKNRGVCSPGSIIEAIGNDYRLKRPVQKRGNPGQAVRLDLSGDGEDRLRHAAMTEYEQPMNPSDYVCRKIIEHFGGKKNV